MQLVNGWGGVYIFTRSFKIYTVEDLMFTKIYISDISRYIVLFPISETVLHYRENKVT